MNELRLMGIQMGPAKDLLEIIDNLKNQVIDLTAPIKEPENSTIVLDECYSQEVILANGMPQGEELESCEETPLMKKSKLELPAQSCEETPPIKKIKLELSAKTSSTINSERADTSKQSSTRSRQGVNSPSNSNGHHKSVKVDEDEFTRYGTVKDTLNSSPQGKEVVKILQGADSALPVGARKSLVRLVIAELVQVQGTIYPPHEAKEALAKALITEFPFLKDCRRPFGFERFYDPVTKKGFFHWRLQTLQRKAPKDQKMYNKSESAVKSSSSNTSLELPLLTEEENSAEISLLKRKSGDDGHRLVIENGLRKTFPNRRDWIKKKAPSSKEILHVYSHFQSYRGDMVDLEFFLIAKSEEKGDKFLKMFSSYYVPRIFSYCKSHREDLLRKHSDVVNGDLKAVLILIDLLPIPNGMYNCNKNKAKATEKPRKEKSAKNKASKRQVKPGKQSAKEAASQKNLSIYEYLIENVSNQSQIENFIQNKIKKSSESIQPYIICTEKTNYFVVIDGIFLSRKDTTDFVGAFDLLFKVYYVMNLEYPIPLLYFYYYVESSIYEINDCVVNTVSDLHVALKFTKVMDFESVDEDDDEESDDSSDGDDNSD